ncbi:MAG: type IX secretion system sortase PorU, partial [Paludibacteraceae bacterium]|nr:type IX secretion system sortase PorU [Paludibacteraceae bacterium]
MEKTLIRGTIIGYHKIKFSAIFFTICECKIKRQVYTLLLLILSLPMLAGIHSYTEQSVLSSGHWVKIRVSESGVCRMSFSELQQAGLNPQQLRVYGYGGAMLEQDFTQKKIDDLPQVPVYVGSDYVLFWVQGPVAWKYNGTRYQHTRNTYSEYGYYMLTDNIGSLLSPTEDETITGTPTEVSTYQVLQVHEYDSINLIDRSGVSGGGRNFYGEQFDPGQTRTFSFATPNAIEGRQSMLTASLAAKSTKRSTFYVKLNSKTEMDSTSEIPADKPWIMANTCTISMTSSSKTNQQQVAITYHDSVVSSLGWLDYIELVTPCLLTMNGDWMGIRTDVNYKSSEPVRFHLIGATGSTQIWDVTDLGNIRKMPATLNGNELQWTGTQADGIHEYIAVNPLGNRFVSATIVGNVANQNLHALKDIDYVIICPDSMMEISRDLAQAHQDKEGITWAVVSAQQVYNEFSSGTPDATAYRWLMKMLYDRADGINKKPRWLLLIGHGSFDNRGLLGSKSGARLLLTYEAKNSVREDNAYMSDDYFGFLDDIEGTDDAYSRMDIGVGRLPVYNKKEAREVVDKLIAYIRNEKAGSWKNQIIFLADDGGSGDHTRTAEEAAEIVRRKNPDFIVNKVYLDAYPQEVNASGESYPLAKNRLDNLLKKGALFFDYSGHGGYNAITNESMLDLKEIEQMNNRHHAFWLFATCSFAHCDGGKRSAAEAAVLNPMGGAIGVLSATRTVYIDGNSRLNNNICDTLFGHKNAFHYDMTIGEAIAIGKNTSGSNPNKLAYVLLGDPAIRSHYPADYQVQPMTQIDILNALTLRHVDGQIVDEDDVVISDFDG